MALNILYVITAMEGMWDSKLATLTALYWVCKYACRSLHFLQFDYPTIQPNLTPFVTGTGGTHRYSSGRVVRFAPAWWDWERRDATYSITIIIHELLPKYQITSKLLNLPTAILLTNENQHFSENRHLKPTLFPSALGTTIRSLLTVQNIREGIIHIRYCTAQPW
jgi:hypothetical protein